VCLAAKARDAAAVRISAIWFGPFAKRYIPGMSKSTECSTDVTHLFRLHRGAFSVVSLNDKDDDPEFWRTRTPLERMTALEYLRRMAYGSAATARLQRVLVVAELKSD
jgi:hypothetical protein